LRVLVTGSAGFIGFHTAMRLLDDGHEVIGLDNLNAYYDVSLKEARLAPLEARNGYRHYRLDLIEREAVLNLFATERPERVIHLAAQAGVRYSLERPDTYVDSNVVGFLSILEACRHHKVVHLVFASTSSVYGGNGKLPFSVHDGADHPLTIYSATKKANEMMAHAYAHLFHIPATGLRFFTVYGPWGRPDMALFKFTKAILEGKEIEVYGHGEMQRDFTYVGDIVDGILAALNHPAEPAPDWNAADPDPATSGIAPYRILNLGNGKPVGLMTYIGALEAKLGRKAMIKMLSMQPGDVQATAADLSDTSAYLGFTPKVAIDEGIARFVDWYLDYYKSAS
jgi:UDP-glucuronate 4-epimerase